MGRLDGEVGNPNWYRKGPRGEGGGGGAIRRHKYAQ